MKRKNRLLSLLLCVAVALALVPGAIFVVADNVETREGGGLADAVAFADDGDGDALVLTTGDIVYYGSYPQSDLGTVGAITPPPGVEGVDWVTADALDYYDRYYNDQTDPEAHYYKIEPIAWRVLENASGKLLLLSQDVLDVEPYNYTTEVDEAVTWSSSTIREWLNDDTAGFLGKAFTQNEQNMIYTTPIFNYEFPEYTSGGIVTRDMIFLLSVPEAQDTTYGFITNPNSVDEPTRGAKATDYARGKTVEYYDWAFDNNYSGFDIYDNTTGWWLRSPGYNEFHVAVVQFTGIIDEAGMVPSFTYINPCYGVRPALNLKWGSMVTTYKNGRLTLVPKSDIPDLTPPTTPPVDDNALTTTPPGGDNAVKPPADNTPAQPYVTAIRTLQKTLYLKKGTTFTPPVYVESVDSATRKAGTAAELAWASSKPKVATVDKEAGTIRAKEAGTAKITATALNGKKLTITVKVVQKAVKVKKVTLIKPPASLKAGKTATLKVKVTPAKATNLNVKFSSSNKKVLTVDKAGKLTALKKGKAKITVKVGKKTYAKTITVK